MDGWALTMLQKVRKEDEIRITNVPSAESKAFYGIKEFFWEGMKWLNQFHDFMHHEENVEVPLQLFLRSVRLKFVVYYFFHLWLDLPRYGSDPESGSGYRKKQIWIQKWIRIRNDPEGELRIQQCFGSWSGLDPDSIRLADPDPESGSGSKRAKITH